MGESNGNRQTRQNQPLQEAGNERNGKKIKEIEDIISAYDFMKVEGLSEIEFDANNIKFHIKRKVDSIIPRSHPVVVEHEQEKEEISDAASIKSPLSGTFYCSPKHGEPPFVNVGDVVEEGKTLCIIEAMKIMNEIKADFSCKIIKILAVNKKSISSGEVLFLVKPV
ncbi:MAG: acetyl-CoA carboxylase, biotin carboxyl carrier protein [Elusimicrobia bacterium]|nr:acetyl-CoA carboxylase, biotin carboxyl carrier protein [Elusimicrobiota bacterium]